MTVQSNFPSIKPSLLLDFANVKALDPRITFTRTTTATYYDGKTTAKAEENLLIRSQEFDQTGWSAASSTVITANTTVAPDGTTTADTVKENSTTNFHIVSQDVSSTGVVTLSVFAKAGAGSRYLTIGVNRALGSYASATFDLSTQTETQTLIAGYSGSVTTTVTASTESFYRYSMTVTTDGVTNARIGLSATSTFSNFNRGFDSFAGDDTSSIILWGAQLEQRSAVSSYTPTTTARITNYIPVLQTAASGVARFDHNPTTGESLGLLVEEQRTNLVTYSAEFDDSDWTKSASSITANTIVAPDGTLTGDKLVEDTNTNTHLVQPSPSPSYTSGTTYTYSVFAKAAERTFLQLRVSASNTFSASFDLSAGTASQQTAGTTATVVPVGNDWYRCSITFTANATGTGASRIGVMSNATTQSYLGDGTSGIYIWGAQLEAGAFPTSYIPTTSASVTRNADAASMTGTNFSSWYRADEGAVYCEAATVNFSTNKGTWAIGNNSLAFGSGNMFYETYISSVSGRRGVNSFTSGSQRVADLGSIVSQSVNTFSKGIFTYKVNDFAQSTNGASASTDTSGTVPIGVTGLSIGSLASGWSGATTYLNGTIKKLAFYPSRLADAQLQALTTV